MKRKRIVIGDDGADDLLMAMEERSDKSAELAIKVAILCLIFLVLIFIGFLVYLGAQ